MMKYSYIGRFEITNDHRAEKFVVHLPGRSHECGVVSPRLDVHLEERETWQRGLLFSCHLGFIELTTVAGIMNQEERRQKPREEKAQDSSSRCIKQINNM